MCSYFEEVLEFLPKPSNSVEGWLEVSRLIAADHLNIWKYIYGIHKEQSLNQLKIEQLVCDQQDPVPRKKYRLLGEDRRLAQNFDRDNLCDYLRRMA